MNESEDEISTPGEDMDARFLAVRHMQMSRSPIDRLLAHRVMYEDARRCGY